MSEEKLDFTLLCTKYLRGVVRVMEDGMNKPGREEDSWKDIGGDYDLVRLRSLLRHTMDLVEGKYYDEESGLPNIDHIASNCMIIRHHQVRNGRILDNSNVVKGDIKLDISKEHVMYKNGDSSITFGKAEYILAPGSAEAENPCLKNRLTCDKVLDNEYRIYYNRNKLPTKDYNDG